MGLYGASTNCWDMSTAAHHTFDGFWETLAFVVNSLVFMWSGAHVVNFFIRCAAEIIKIIISQSALSSLHGEVRSFPGERVLADVCSAQGMGCFEACFLSCTLTAACNWANLMCAAVRCCAQGF